MSAGRLSAFHQARLLCLPQTMATQSHGTSSVSQHLCLSEFSLQASLQWVFGIWFKIH